MQLDYTAGVLPITKVNATLDALTSLEAVVARTRNTISRDAYEMYNARLMAGLPIGVQVVGQRLEEEKVFAGMRLVERVMKEKGFGYELLAL